MECFVEAWITFVDNVVLRILNSLGWQSVTLKRGDAQRKLRDGQRQKARAVVWQWAPTF